MNRKPKPHRLRGDSSEAELKAWSRTFYCGRDWFGALVPFGFARLDHDAVQAGARDAWSRLGHLYLKTLPATARWGHAWLPGAPCWAIEAFGLPRKLTAAERLIWEQRVAKAKEFVPLDEVGGP